MLNVESNYASTRCFDVILFHDLCVFVVFCTKLPRLNVDSRTTIEHFLDVSAPILNLPSILQFCYNAVIQCITSLHNRDTNRKLL